MYRSHYDKNTLPKVNGVASGEESNSMDENNPIGGKAKPKVILYMGHSNLYSVYSDLRRELSILDGLTTCVVVVDGV
jgi:hypothetical protein